MSTSAVVEAVGANVKTRRVWAVILLTIVTFGIYGVVWYYKINREMRDFGGAHGDDRLGASRPVRSVIAYTLGEIVVLPALISVGQTIGRVQSVEWLVFGRAKPAAMASIAFAAAMVLSVWVHLGGFLWPGAGLVGPACCLAAMGMVQARLNAAWTAAAGSSSPALRSRSYGIPAVR